MEMSNLEDDLLSNTTEIDRLKVQMAQALLAAAEGRGDTSAIEILLPES